PAPSSRRAATARRATPPRPRPSRGPPPPARSTASTEGRA
ncbi:MAG: hypothetical protein AVDCRST_MAG30-3736, partial [uncultured Solirubrobacteraceae bacterium]